MEPDPDVPTIAFHNRYGLEIRYGTVSGDRNVSLFGKPAQDARTTGAYSPAINAGGDVSVVQGYSADEVQILVAAAVTGATASHAKAVADLAAQIGATKEAILNFLRIMGEKRVGPDHLLETLSELGEKYRAAGERIASLASADEDTQRLLDDAKAANELGDYATADRLLAQAEQAEMRAADALQAQAEERLAKVAEVRAGRGLLALAALRFGDAAQLFDSALEALPKGRSNMWFNLTMLRGEALERQGIDQGDNGALLQAIKTYDGLIGDDAVAQSARLTVLLALGRARTALGTRESDPKRLFEAIGTFELALKYCPGESDNDNWITIQTSIGIAFGQIGRRSRNTCHFECCGVCLCASAEQDRH